MSGRLHVLNKAPDHPRFNRCLETMSDGDRLILMESGLFALTPERVDPRLKTRQIAALAPDAEDLSTHPDIDVSVLDYGDFIALICEHGSPVMW